MTDAKPPEYQIEASSCYTKIRYMVRVVGGPVLKGVPEREVMDFVTGYAQVIPGLEKRLIGRTQGERLSFSVPPEEAFGPRFDELLIEKNRSEFHFPPGMTPYPGMEIPLLTGHPDGPDTALIREVRDDTIVIDCNHPLAGATLEYDLEILETRPAKPTDVCAEWEERPLEAACSGSVPVVVLGQQDPDEA